MIERLYVHNYRCLENFTLDLKGKGSALLIGKNGSGKSAVRQALGVLQKIGRGPNRVAEWIQPGDFTQQRWEVPVRIAIDLALDGQSFRYSISFKMNEKKQPVVADEELQFGAEPVFARRDEKVELLPGGSFELRGDVAALPLLGHQFGNDPRQVLREYLAGMVLLAPVPSRMSGYADRKTADLNLSADNFTYWLNAILIRFPAAYAEIQSYLSAVMPDFESIENTSRGEGRSKWWVHFRNGKGNRSVSVEFDEMSDGEKCFFLCAAVLAANKVSGPLFCFWDEPDNHLSLPEVGHFILELRRIANQGGQFVATTHNPEAIRRFSAENTLVLTRNSHLEPTLIRPLSEITYNGDLINALTRDEVIG